MKRRLVYMQSDESAGRLWSEWITGMMGLGGISENTNVFLSTTPTSPSFCNHPDILYFGSDPYSPRLASTPHRSNVKTYLENKRGVNMCKRTYLDANAHSASRSRNILITLSCWDQPPTNCIIDVEFDQHFSPFSEYITIFWGAPWGSWNDICVYVKQSWEKAYFLTADLLVLVEELYSSIWDFLFALSALWKAEPFLS